jgi:hypothetical protein
VSDRFQLVLAAHPADLPAGRIEYTTLPSGLHTLKTDLVFLAHGADDLPGFGLFRSVEVQGTGRGRRMGTLGVVLGGFGPPPAVPNHDGWIMDTS